MNATDVIGALVNALSFSSILILVALGLAITFGVMRVINMAHGEMLMLGAYTAYVLEDPQAVAVVVRNVGRLLGTGWTTEFGFHLNLYCAIPIAFLLVGAVGYLLEVCLIRFLYGRPLDTLLATWGVSLIIQQMVLFFFEADLKPMRLPAALDGNWQLAGIAIPRFRLFVVAVTGLCLAAVYLWFFKTPFGLKIRAVTQNRPMAAALGISTRQVDSLTFAFASGLAGVAGCIMGHLFTAKYNMGADYVVEAFMVVILGGMGQLTGTIASGAILGSGDSILEKLFVNASLAKVVVLLAVIGFIMVRPSGLFAARERSYE